MEQKFLSLRVDVKINNKRTVSEIKTLIPSRSYKYIFVSGLVGLFLINEQKVIFCRRIKALFYLVLEERNFMN